MSNTKSAYISIQNRVSLCVNTRTLSIYANGALDIIYVQNEKALCSYVIYCFKTHPYILDKSVHDFLR